MSTKQTTVHEVIIEEWIANHQPLLSLVEGAELAELDGRLTTGYRDFSLRSDRDTGALA